MKKIFTLIFALMMLVSLNTNSQTVSLEAFPSYTLNLDTVKKSKFDVKEVQLSVNNFDFGSSFVGYGSLLYKDSKVDLYSAGIGYNFTLSNVSGFVTIGKLENYWFAATKKDFSFRDPLTTGFLPRNEYGAGLIILGTKVSGSVQVFNGTSDTNKAALVMLVSNPVKNMTLGGYAYTTTSDSNSYNVFGGKVGYNFMRKGFTLVDLAVEAGLSRFAGSDQAILTSVDATLWFPKSGYNCGVGFHYSNINPMSGFETRTLIGALKFDNSSYQVNLGFKNTKGMNDVQNNSLFLATGFKF